MQYEISRTQYFDANASIPLEKACISAKIGHVLRTRMSIIRLFDMQSKVLDFVIHMANCCAIGDVILCAPTGSGKTLAYALPIVDHILGGDLKKLIAIVVVPTRDLALQVFNVFKILTESLGLKVSVISGAAPILSETEEVLNCQILIATPGRLIDHIERHQDLSLLHVRFLVLDESDRLLEGPYQRWIDIVVPLLGRPRKLEKDDKGNDILWRPTYGLLEFAMNPHIMTLNSTSTGVSSEECVRKILVSATQTKNPMRVVKLGLRKAVFFAPKRHDSKENSNEQAEYTVPPTLTEKGWVVRHIQDKPMALLKILGWSKAVVPHEVQGEDEISLPAGGAKLVFTNSVESAHRLCRLLEVYAHISGLPVNVLEMSGDLSSQRRRQVLDAVREGKGTSVAENQSPIVVCSDVLARGMDMLNVDAVVNYDVPAHISTYVHRVGRTARAGRLGVAVTLMLQKQAHHFKAMVREAERGGRKVKVENINLYAEDRSRIFQTLSHALTLLRRIVRREKLGLLSTDEALPNHALYEMYIHMQKDSADHESEFDEGITDERDGSLMQSASNEDNLISRKRKFDDGDNEDDEQAELATGDVFNDLLYAQIAKNFFIYDS